MIDVDVTICRNVERLFNNLPGSDVRHIRLECACSCEGVRAATSNRYNLIIRFNHIPLSRDKQQGAFIHNHKDSFKSLQEFIFPPLFRKFYSCTLQVAVKTVQLLFNLLKEGKSICHRTCNSCQTFSILQFTSLSYDNFHDGTAHRSLSITTNRHGTIMHDTEYGGRL